MARITKTNIAAQYIFDEIMQLIISQGINPADVQDDWFIELEDYKYYYDDSIRKSTFNRALELVKEAIYSGEYYCADGKYLLQLNDNHTLWQINLTEDYIKDNHGGDFEMDYCYMVEEALDNFKEETNIEIGCYGRSGRHICVDITLENLQQYAKLVKLQKELENNIIDYFNNYKTDKAA